MKDSLTDFEKAEQYRKLYVSRGIMIIVFSILSFVLGFLVARIFYLK